MSHQPKEIYNAACNPPRRAKKALPTRSPSPSDSNQPNQPRVILPMRPYAPRPGTATADVQASVPPPTAKRGRKPGPLSRSAREAQRRLNHSIIEKARRTKINDALATLKQLVPADYGRQEVAAADVEDDSEYDDEDENPRPRDGSKNTKTKTKTGKREEREKEFKLEILVRTVSFLQDLLVRVSDLEKAKPSCDHCQSNKTEAKKRKRSHSIEDVEAGEKESRSTQPLARPTKSPRLDSTAFDSSNRTPLTSPSKSLEAPKGSNASQSDPRLPPISSWLPPSVLHPVPSGTSRDSYSYLPSPPSTHFDPVRNSAAPPALNLGPVATAALVTRRRTIDDENAASLLLQISASSPPFRPIPSDTSRPASEIHDSSNISLQSGTPTLTTAVGRRPRVLVQTPGSILGLNHSRNNATV